MCSIGAVDRVPETWQIVARGMRGCEDAYSVLVPSYVQAVRAICRKRIAGEDLDDLVQEVFLRVFRTLHRLEDPRQFYAYLARITNNLCTDRLRSRLRMRRFDVVSIEDLDAELPAPEDAEDIRLQDLELAFRGLPVRHAEVLRMFHFDKLSYTEMSVRLGISPSAVNQRLSRARKHLRRAVGSRLAS